MHGASALTMVSPNNTSGFPDSHTICGSTDKAAAIIVSSYFFSSTGHRAHVVGRSRRSYRVLSFSFMIFRKYDANMHAVVITARKSATGSAVKTARVLSAGKSAGMR